jgi:hypothetical protein
MQKIFYFLYFNTYIYLVPQKIFNFLAGLLLHQARPPEGEGQQPREARRAPREAPRRTRPQGAQERRGAKGAQTIREPVCVRILFLKNTKIFKKTFFL